MLWRQFLAVIKTWRMCNKFWYQQRSYPGLEMADHCLRHMPCPQLQDVATDLLFSSLFLYCFCGCNSWGGSRHEETRGTWHCRGKDHAWRELLMKLGAASKIVYLIIETNVNKELAKMKTTVYMSWTYVNKELGQIQTAIYMSSTMWTKNSFR